MFLSMLIHSSDYQMKALEKVVEQFIHTSVFSLHSNSGPVDDQRASPCGRTRSISTGYEISLDVACGAHDLVRLSFSESGIAGLLRGAQCEFQA
jgi:hypothetical protein